MGWGGEVGCGSLFLGVVCAIRYLSSRTLIWAHLLSGACAERQVAYIGEALRGRGRLDCLGAVEWGSGLVWC